MAYIVRGIDWNRTDSEGVPLDCHGIMSYFNNALKKHAYPLVPRDKPITAEEILTSWVPNINRTISKIATDDSQRVIGAATLFLDIENMTGELSITKSQDYHAHGVGTDLARVVIESAHAQGFTVCVHTSTENKAMIRVMQKLGYDPIRLVSDYEKYKGKIRASTYDAYEWKIPPRILI